MEDQLLWDVTIPLLYPNQLFLPETTCNKMLDDALTTISEGSIAPLGT